MVDEHTLFDFYDARVGAECVSGAHFDTWWKRTRRERPDLLTFDPAMLTHDAADEIREADYPQEWQSSLGEGLTFPISYHFEPGAAEDGLTIDVPVATLNRVAADDFSWNVPGLREELVTSLIRSLPKNLRVSFVPAPNRAREFLAAVPAGEEPLLDALERYLRSTTGVVVPREAWDWAKVPEHLRPTYRVVDDAGREQARGKDLEALKEPLRPTFAAAMAEVAADSGVTATGQTAWTFGTVEESFTQRRAGHEVRGHPGLVDEGETVGLGGLRLRRRAGGPAPPRRAPAAAARPRRRRCGRCSARSTTPQKLGLAGSPYPSVAELLEDCRAAVARPWSTRTRRRATRPAFDGAAPRGHAGPGGAPAGRARRRAAGAGGAGGRPRSCSAGAPSWSLLPALHRHARPARAGWCTAASWRRPGPPQLRRYPTYLAAIEQRRERLDHRGAAAATGPAADGPGRRPAGGLAAPGRGAARRDAAGRGACGGCAGCSRSYRVSLWAQQLGTAYPVSDQRIRKALRDSRPPERGVAVTTVTDRPHHRPMTPGSRLLRRHRGRRRPRRGQRGGRPRRHAARPRRARDRRRGGRSSGCCTSPTTEGIETIAEVWSGSPADSLAGCLWRLYLLRSWVYADPVGVAAPVRGRPGPRPGRPGRGRGRRPARPRRAARRWSTRCCAGSPCGDFADVLLRAAAFARVVATGRAVLAESTPAEVAADAGAGRAARGGRPRRAASDWLA